MSCKGEGDTAQGSPEEVLKSIEQEVKSDTIVMYIKGTKSAPQCGFSAATIGIFSQLGKPFTTVDVLSNPDRRQMVPQYSNWPTFPQVFIKGEFIGGCDIVHELQEQGELQKIVEKAFT